LQFFVPSCPGRHAHATRSRPGIAAANGGAQACRGCLGTAALVIAACLVAALWRIEANESVNGAVVIELLPSVLDEVICVTPERAFSSGHISYPGIVAIRPRFSEGGSDGGLVLNDATRRLTCGTGSPGGRISIGRMSRANRVRLVSDMHRRGATNVLRRESARSIAGCYVNPNARGTAVANAQVIVARSNGRVVGYLVFCTFAAQAHVPLVQAMLKLYPGTPKAYSYGPICVAESERGRGLAGAMFAALRARLPEGALHSSAATTQRHCWLIKRWVCKRSPNLRTTALNSSSWLTVGDQIHKT
jgi:hypothetical protein